MSFFSTKNRSLSILILTFVSLSILACGTDSDPGASLDGDLSYEVQGAEGEEVMISKTTYDGDEVRFETVTSVTVPAEGDLENGNYEGYQLQASPFGEETPDITLRLLSDGEVLGETSSPTENGVFLVEVGEMPEFPEQ